MSEEPVVDELELEAIKDRQQRREERQRRQDADEDAGDNIYKEHLEEGS